MPSFKSNNFDQNGLKIKLFLQQNFERWGKTHTPETASQPLRISCYELDAEHPTRLALSDVEPRFQKLLKRNGDKCLIKLLFFFGNYSVGSQLFLRIGFLYEFGWQKKIVKKHCFSEIRSGLKIPDFLHIASAFCIQRQKTAEADAK